MFISTLRLCMPKISLYSFFHQTKKTPRQRIIIPHYSLHSQYNLWRSIYCLLRVMIKIFTVMNFTKGYDTSVRISTHNKTWNPKTEIKVKIPSMEPIFANITLDHKFITVVWLSTQTINSLHRHFYRLQNLAT